MRYIVPVAIGIITAVVTFSFFSGLLAFPIKIISSYIIEPLLKLSNHNNTSSNQQQQQYPVAFTLKGDQPYKVIYSTEEQNDILVYEYWYVWNHDGSQKIDDPEPIFVYYKGLFGYSSSDIKNSVIPFALAHREHYRWTIKYDGIITQGNNPVITFLTASHTPENNYPIQPKTYEEVKLKPKQETLIPYEGKDPWRILDMTRVVEHSLLYASAAGACAFAVSLWATNRSTKRKIAVK